MSLFESLRHGVLNGLDTARHDVEAGYRIARKEALFVIHDPAAAARTVGTWAFDQLIGNDIKTLTSDDPKITVADKVLAGISIASNFVGPEGKLLDKALTELAKTALEHGGERLAATGLKRLEEVLGEEAYKELAAHGGKMAKALGAGIETAEKVLDKLGVARGIKDALTTTLVDLKKTAEDLGAAVSGPDAGRAAAWERVTKDLMKDGIDVSRVYGAVKDGRAAIAAPKPASLSHLQHDATATLLQDAEKFKGPHGRTFVEGKNLVIDVRTSKDFIAETNATLRAMHGDARTAGKHLVVYAPNVSEKQERTLLAEGISIAKTPGDLMKLSIAAKAPGRTGIALIDLDKRTHATELAQALHARHEDNDTRDTMAATLHSVGRGAAGIGKHHAAAKRWDGREAVHGSIAWARDGEVQQYFRGRWISYDANKLSGDAPVEGHQVTIKPDPAHPGFATVSDPLQHEHEHEHARVAPIHDAAPSR